MSRRERGGGTDRRPGELDPDNRLLWRMTPRRLEAEVLRDAMLAVSETLNLQAGGPGFKPYIPARGQPRPQHPGRGLSERREGRRRQPTTKRLHVSQAADSLSDVSGLRSPGFADQLCSPTEHDRGTQAMVMLNDGFVRACAGDFAQRLIEMPPARIDQRRLVQASFELAFSRATDEVRKVEASIQFIKPQTQAASRSDRSDLPPRSTDRLLSVTVRTE